MWIITEFFLSLKCAFPNILIAQNNPRQTQQSANYLRFCLLTNTNPADCNDVITVLLSANNELIRPKRNTATEGANNSLLLHTPEEPNMHVKEIKFHF